MAVAVHTGLIGQFAREDQSGMPAGSLSIGAHLVRGALYSPEAVELFRKLVWHSAFSDIADGTHVVAGDKNDVFGVAIADWLVRTNERSEAT